MMTSCEPRQLGMGIWAESVTAQRVRIFRNKLSKLGGTRGLSGVGICPRCVVVSPRLAGRSRWWCLHRDVAATTTHNGRPSA